MKDIGDRLVEIRSSRQPLSVGRLVQAAKAADRKETENRLFDTQADPGERLGAVIGWVRRRKNLTQQELSSRSGCPLAVLLDLEAGLLDIPTINQYLPAILAGLGIHPAALRQIIESEE